MIGVAIITVEEQIKGRFNIIKQASTRATPSTPHAPQPAFPAPNIDPARRDTDDRRFVDVRRLWLRPSATDGGRRPIPPSLRANRGHIHAPPLRETAILANRTCLLYTSDAADE